MIKTFALRYGAGIAFLLTGLALACVHLDRPGLSYDEILFVNAAIGGATDNFIAKHVLGIPLYLMDYIGALKAWVHAPIFYLFGINDTTIRLPSLLIGAAGGLFLCLIALRVFGATAFTITALLLFTQPAFIGHLRFDWGPTSLMFLFRGLALWACLRWIEQGATKWLWLAVIAMELGTFDKLNFLWVDYSILLALLVVYRSELRQAWQLHRRRMVAVALATALIVLGNTRRALRLAQDLQDASTDWLSRADYVAGMLMQFVRGSGVMDYVSRQPEQLPGYVLAAYAVLLALALPGLFWSRDKAARRVLSFLVVVMLGVFLNYCITPTAIGPHHIAVLLGLPQLCLAGLLALALAHGGREYRIVVWLLLAVVFFGQSATTAREIDGFSRPNTNMDAAHMEAAQFASRLPDARLILTDWGIGNQITAAGKGHQFYVEAAWAIRDAKSARAVMAQVDPARNNYLVGRVPGRESIAGNWQRAIDALNETHTRYSVVKDFPDYAGQALIRIVKIESP